MKLKNLIHKTKHTSSLKMPLEGSTSNSKPSRHRLALKVKGHRKANSPGGDSIKDIKFSIRAYRWSRILLKGSISNFKSNRQRLTLHQHSNCKIQPLGGGNYRGHHSSNRAHGWSRNTSKGLHVKFQVILTTFDQTLTSSKLNQASLPRIPLGL